MTFRVLGVGAGGCRASVNGGAARSVCNNHAVAEKLSDEFDVRSLAAARARAREFEQRLTELAALDGFGLEFRADVFLCNRAAVIPVGFFFLRNGFERHHLKRLYFGGANVCAAAAARAVKRRNLNTEVVFGKTHSGFYNVVFGSFRRFFLGGENRSYACVRANQRALSALYAVFGNPHGQGGSDTALLELSGAGGDVTVGLESGDGQFVAFLSGNRLDERAEVRIGRSFHHGRALSGGSPIRGILDFHKALDGFVHAGVVHVDDSVAFLAVSLFDHLLHVIGSLLVRNDVCKLEESRLANGVDALSCADFSDYLKRVESVEFDMLLCNLVLHLVGEFLVQLIFVPDGVKQEYAAFLKVGHHVVTGNVRLVVAGDEIGLVDKVGGFNGGFTEAQVRNGKTAALFGVVRKIALSVHIGMVADDFDAVLVCAHRSVGTKSVELAAACSLGGSVDEFFDGERSVRHVVGDAHREVVFGIFLFKVFVNRANHGGVEFLAAQSVSAAVNLDVAAAGFGKRCANVEVKRFAQRACFFSAVKHRDFLYGSGNSVHKVFYGERTVKSYFQKANFLALFCKIIDRFFRRFAARTHHDDDFFGVGRSVILIKLILSARELRYLFHHFLDDAGYSLVIFVGSLAVLEINVAVLSGAHLNGMLGIKRARFEASDIFHIHKGKNLVVFDAVDFAYLVAGAESVEKVEERHAGFKRGKVRDKRKVHDFLHGIGGQHGKTGLTARHYVRMVTEDVKRVRGKRPGADVEHGGKKLARDFVHIGDHQQQALACGVSGSQCARHQRAVHRTCGAAFGFHFGKS